MWYDTESKVMPSAVDNTSSAAYVYVRKDIETIEREGETLYAYKEQKILKSNWELYTSIINHDSELAEVQDALIELAEIIGG